MLFIGILGYYWTYHRIILEAWKAKALDDPFYFAK